MTIEPPEAHCWLHPDVEVGASPIAGRGLIARAAIRPGEPVSRLGGRLVSGAELRNIFAAARTRQDAPYVDTILVADDVHLVVAPGQNRFGNHSCDPNTWWIDAYTLAARRLIRPGEEVTNDYATSTGDSGFRLACSCGSRLCRGVVTGADWRSAELRRRYGDHWVPGLLARMRRQS